MIARKAGRRTFLVVQALRGVAAAMVVLYHGSQTWSNVALGNEAGAWTSGASGVDLFFVISGFVMVVSTLGGQGGGVAAWAFLKRRLVRIVPLYWVVTTALLLKVAFSAWLSHAGKGVSPSFLACSYLLIPCHNPGGSELPLLGPGWTLWYELFFYACFAVALWSRRPVVPLLTAVLGVLALSGGMHADHTPVMNVVLSPLLLEFLGGVWVGRLLLAGWRPRSGWVMALGGVALLLLLVVPDPVGSPFARLRWGVLAVMVVWSAVALETRVGHLVPRWLLLLGDASYSIYLAHSPLLGLWKHGLERVLVPGRVRGSDEAVTMLVVLGLSVGMGLGCYVWVERPMNEWVSRVVGVRVV